MFPFWAVLSRLEPQLTAAEKGDVIQVAGRGTAHLICADDRGELTCYDKIFPWALAETFHGSIGQSIPHLHAAVRHIASSRAGSKARVELELQVSGILLQGIPHEVVFSASPGEEYPGQQGWACALPVLCPKRGGHF